MFGSFCKSLLKSLILGRKNLGVFGDAKFLESDGKEGETPVLSFRLHFVSNTSVEGARWSLTIAQSTCNLSQACRVGLLDNAALNGW